MAAVAVPIIIAGISALAGALSNKGKTTTGTQTTDQNTDTSQNINMSPSYDPKQLAMRDFLLKAFYNRANGTGIDDVIKSYTNGAVNNINSSAQSSEQALRNMLASRGLSYSSAAGTALAQGQSDRFAQINSVRNQGPLLHNALESQNLTDFSTFLRGLPTGQQSIVNTSSNVAGNGTSTNTDPGNMLAGGVNGLGSSLALMYGSGAFSGDNKGSKGNMNTSGGGSGRN